MGYIIKSKRGMNKRIIIGFTAWKLSGGIVYPKKSPSILVD